MKALCTVLIVLLAAPVYAQGPLTAQAHAALAEQHKYDDWPVTKSRMENPVVFWTGLVLVGVGVLTAIASVSWAQQSDLSDEFVGVRLGTDLAPCGTDPTTVRMPVAECKMNPGLFWVGTGVAAIGGGMMVWGGRQVQTVVPPHSLTGVHYTLRF